MADSEESAGVVPKPSLTHTYKWADGDLIGDDYGWMSEIDLFQQVIEYDDTPRDVLVERWERTSYEVRTLYPPLVSCTYGDDDHDDDAVAWQRDGERWMQACEEHRRAPHSASRETPDA